MDAFHYTFFIYMHPQVARQLLSILNILLAIKKIKQLIFKKHSHKRLRQSIFCQNFIKVLFYVMKSLFTFGMPFHEIVQIQLEGNKRIV